MTDREKAIVMAYTGTVMLVGDKFSIYHKYIEDICGRPIYTHEIAFLEEEIKEKSHADFIKLCHEETHECDCISREAAINCVTAASMCDPIITQKRLKLLPSVHPKTEWIPVIERLPEEYGYYITTTLYREVYCDYWNGETFKRTEIVLAWMPLPEPYRGSEG